MLLLGEGIVFRVPQAEVLERLGVGAIIVTAPGMGRADDGERSSAPARRIFFTILLSSG
jgi:hypothetical protein